MYTFDVLADRKIGRSRKWDFEILQKKYPGLPKDFILSFVKLS